jgi:hypothetical protein
MRYEGVAGPALLGLLAFAACREPTPPPVGVAVSPSVTSTVSASPSGPPLASASPSASPSPSPSHSATPAGPVTGLQGAVSAGPTCPVERVDSPCPPRPLSAEIDARDASGHLAGSTRSGSDGQYRLALLPGTYTLTVAAPGPFPRCPTPTATVIAGKVAMLDIGCDTGIR